MSTVSLGKSHEVDLLQGVSHVQGHGRFSSPRPRRIDVDHAGLVEPAARLVYAARVADHPHTVFSMEVRAEAADIDDLDHVSNLVYVRWVQQVAAAHSTAVGYDFEAYRKLGAVFVVRRHEIDYLRSAVLGDRIGLRTWVDSWKAASSVRMTSIVRLGGPGDAVGDASIEASGDDNAIELARARTTWALVSLDSGRPVRIPPELSDRFVRPVL
jgi:acyl-CoA thioester hydrolase